MKKSNEFILLIYSGIVSMFMLMLQYYNGIVSDELGSSPDIILGSKGMNIFSWVLTFLSVIVFIYSLTCLIKNKNN